VTTANRAQFAFRVVQAATLVALLWKVVFFAGAARLYFEMPLRQQFFPAFLQSPTTFVGGYALAIIGLLGMLVAWGSRVRQTLSWLTLIALTVLCLHQGSYNDATFTTAWWATLWSAWFASRLALEGDSLLRRSTWLTQGIVSMILLGGAVGKWTPEYWSGQVFYEIYFVDRDFWTFNWLRENFETGRLQEIATGYSRGVIIIESILGFTLWILPVRIAAVTAISVLAGIAIFSSFYLFSVVLSLIGLAATGLLVPAERVSQDDTQPSASDQHLLDGC